MSGFNPKNPTKYSGTDQFLIPFVSRKRRPLGTDYRQPETGRLYPIGTIWQVGKDPTTGVEGELWMLSKIVANVAYWIQLSGGGTGVQSFVTDDGTAIPAATILDVFGVDSTENNANGILTRANPNLSNVLDIVVTNRLQGTSQTIGAITTNIISFTPTLVGTYSVEARIAAYNTTASLGAAYSLFGGVRFDGAAAHSCDIADKISNEEGAMTSANTNITVSGADILVTGTGYAAQTINWSAVCLYTYIGA